jgi:hypothetical protein
LGYNTTMTKTKKPKKADAKTSKKVTKVKPKTKKTKGLDTWLTKERGLLAVATSVILIGLLIFAASSLLLPSPDDSLDQALAAPTDPIIAPEPPLVNGSPLPIAEESPTPTEGSTEDPGLPGTPTNPPIDIITTDPTVPVDPVTGEPIPPTDPEPVPVDPVSPTDPVDPINNDPTLGTPPDLSSPTDPTNPDDTVNDPDPRFETTSDPLDLNPSTPTNTPATTASDSFPATGESIFLNLGDTPDDLEGDYYFSPSKDQNPIYKEDVPLDIILTDQNLTKCQAANTVNVRIRARNNKYAGDDSKWIDLTSTSGLNDGEIARGQIPVSMRVADDLTVSDTGWSIDIDLTCDNTYYQAQNGYNFSVGALAVVNLSGSVLP